MQAITDVLAQMGGVQSMARELGIGETEAKSGVAALAPAILGGFKKRAQEHPSGLDGLGGLLGQLGGGGLLDDVLAPRPTDVSQGNEVLGQIFGSKEVSRTVAQNAAPKAGLDASLLKKMLPMLAMAVAGLMAKQSGGGAATAASGEGGGMLGGLLRSFGGGKAGGGLAGIGSMLDLDGDGNPLDDILRASGKMLR